MARWSPENATKAYLQALTMGERSKELDEAEFIAAVAAGNNAQLMVIVAAASGATSRSITLPLTAAAQQTGGLVVCILPTLCNIYTSGHGLTDAVKFVKGDARTLLQTDYRKADFVAIDCRIDDQTGMFRSAAQHCGNHGRRIVMGYNAFHRESRTASDVNTRLLPIGEGLLLTGARTSSQVVDRVTHKKRNKWVVKLDQCTGEEHIYRLPSHQSPGLIKKAIKA